MARATFRMYAELNDLLPPARRQRDFALDFRPPVAVKDLIESAGVPHTEVDLIVVGGRSVDFGHRVVDGDRVAVYPVFEALDLAPLLRLRPRPLRHSRFVLDVHLGRLAAYLRLLGFDTLYRNDRGDAELARLSRGEQRILLTRDRGLLKRSEVRHGYWVRQDDPRRQLAEVVARFDLAGQAAPFCRCALCNALLAPVDRPGATPHVPPRVRERCQRFMRCPACAQLYWWGSHTRRVERLFRDLLPPA